MKSNYKIFTAVFLSAIMTAAAPLTVCGAEVFSAGESFSDGTGSIPAILTDMVLPDGEIGTEYQVQLEADTDVNWSLEEGSELPAGFTLSSGGVISGMPQEEGSFSFTVQADNGIGVSSQELSLYVAQREQEPVIKQYELTSGTALIDLGIHAEGEQSRKRLFLYNAGTDSLHLSDFPQSRYFDFSYAPIFDTNTDEEMQPGSCAAVDIDDKKDLPTPSVPGTCPKMTPVPTKAPLASYNGGNNGGTTSGNGGSSYGNSGQKMPGPGCFCLYREDFPDCLPVPDKQGSLRLRSVYDDMYRVFSDLRC